MSNGSFEEKYDCDTPYSLNKAKFWCNIGNDTTKYGGFHHSVCNTFVPYNIVGFQYPKQGETFIRTGFYCLNPCSNDYSRYYAKNRLKQTLKANTTYCVKMFIVRQNQCPYAISNIGFYFGNELTDTIQLANAPITYLNPQVKNPSNNIISDTLNWSPITGTFVADGTEKYMIIGNFDSNAATTYSLVDTSFGNGVWAEYFIDAISCIEMNLPAYAGPDKSIAPGDSVYIGRESDFAIDPGCIWYKLPNTTTAIDTSSGIWVKPSSTSTYVVKQILDCSPEKWDTVIVYMNLTGIVSSSEVENDIRLFPNPANNYLEIKTSNKTNLNRFKLLQIFNQFGQLIIETEVQSIISTEDLITGIYLLQLNGDAGIVRRRFVVEK